jgi:hypothetical protein
MNFGMIMSVIAIHWIADFVLQTDWQAKNKSSNNIALLLHVTTYSICLTFFAVYITLNNQGFMWKEWVIANAVLHFITDYITSRINTYLWSKGRVHDFFVSVGFDQVIHYACLFGTLFYFGAV